jgi:hypothetical protein
MAWQNRFFLARLPSKNKTMREGTVNKQGQEGKCDRPGHCGIENSSWEGRENRGPGGREGETGTDRNIDEGGKWGGETGQEGGGPAHCAKIGRGECTK